MTFISFFKLIPTQTKFLLVAVILLIIVIISISLWKTPSQPTQPSPSPSSGKLNTLQRGIPKTPVKNIESQLQITNKEASSDGSTVYTLKSDNPARPDQLISREGKVAFERIYIPDDPATPGYMTLAEVEQKYGNAEEIGQGSRFWGAFLNTYIYAAKGYAFIANPYTKEVFEMHSFSPMSVDEYKKNYGSDILGHGPQGE